MSGSRSVCLAITLLLLLFSAVAIPAAEPVTYTLAAPLSAPHAIDVDEYGRIYVLDHARESVYCFNPSGELQRSWVDGLHEAILAFGREDIAVIPDGLIYLGGGPGINNVRRIGPGPSDDVTFPMETVNPRDLAVASDGSYYEYDYHHEGPEGQECILAFGPDGEFRTLWATPELGSMAIGPDNLVYGIGYDNKTVSVYSGDGKLQRKFDLKVPDNQHVSTWCMAIDTNGDIYLAGLGIYRFSRNGQLLAQWDAPGYHIAVRNGLVYAISRRPAEPEIRVYTPDGQCVARYVSPKVTVNMPGVIAVHPDGSFAVTECGLADALLFDSADKLIGPIKGPETEIMYVLAKPGGGYYVAAGYSFEYASSDGTSQPLAEGKVTDFTDPNHHPDQIALDPKTGNVWGLGGRGIIMEYSPDGRLIKRLGVNDRLNFRTSSTGMVIDKQGFIYLPNAWGHQIVKVDFEGNIVATWGREGSDLGEMRFPEGLALDDKGRLYVADSGNSRIQVFTTDGEPIGLWGRRGRGPGELDRPYGVAIGPNNTLWISDTHNDRIVKVPLNQFWKEIGTEFVPEAVVPAAKREPVPDVGNVVIAGIVIAGRDDLTDTVYIESPARSWGMRVTVPKGALAMRGDRCKVTGVMELEKRAAKHLIASKLEKISNDKVPGPLGMANLYVGDGYQGTSKQGALSNLGLLVKTWGRVISVDAEKGLFIINDGSYPKDKGLVVYAGKLVKQLSNWPSAGQYVGITGVSITWAASDGSFSPGVRIRGDEDIQVLKEQ